MFMKLEIIGVLMMLTSNTVSRFYRTETTDKAIEENCAKKYGEEDIMKTPSGTKKDIYFSSCFVSENEDESGDETKNGIYFVKFILFLFVLSLFLLFLDSLHSPIKAKERRKTKL